MNALKYVYNSKGTRAALWFVIRLYLAYEWLDAAIEKLGKDSAVWIGPKAGTAVKGYLSFAASPTQTGGDHPNVLNWYAWLINHVFLPNATALSYIVAFGELFVGLALLFGLFTRFAAACAALMNLTYLLAGTTGVNVPMFTLEVFIVLVGGTAALIGMDYAAMPLLKKGVNRVFKRQAPAAPVPAAEPVFRPIDRERYIASEHQVDTPDTTKR
jgi:thiosulfate dehydrogenase [quinone] large subunit